MKAVLCKQFGPPSSLVLEDIPSPQPGEKDILISVKACGVNFPDTLIIQGKYQYKPDLPFSPGSDVAGIVKAVGSKVKQFKPGDEIFSLVSHGGFAEEIVIPENRCFPKPPTMDFKISASFLMAYGTSYYALKERAKIKEGETLVVLGASGGVGLAAVELGKILGAKVIAAASTNEKLQLCKEYGADEIINYQEEDLKSRIKELTHGKGADVIYDPVGGKFTELALRATAWKGRLCIVGFAAGEIPKIPMNLALLKGCEIVGVFWGQFAMKEPMVNMSNTMDLLKFYNEKKINPHIHASYRLENAYKALEEMQNRKVKGKVVITMD